MSERTPEMKAFIDGVAKDFFGKSLTETLSGNTCMFCKEPDFNFKDEASKREYKISGICQKCQDKVFGE